MRRLPLLVLLLSVLHASLALGFAYVTPWRSPGMLYGGHTLDIGAPDEYAHANYVRHFLRGEGFPKLDPLKASAEGTYEDHQPPLFYLLDAGNGRLFGVDVDSQRAKLPLRIVNVLLGALTVVGAFLLVFWASYRPKLALASAAIVAVLPMNVALSSAVSNDPLLYCLSTFVLALGVRNLRTPSVGGAALLGVLVGLAILTKFTGLLLLLILPFFLKDRRQLVFAWSVAMLVAGPWLVRNDIVYGHPLAANAFNATFTRGVDLAEIHTPRGMVKWVHVVGAGTVLSGIGQFGYMDIPLPRTLSYPLIGLVLFGVAFGLRLSTAPVRFRNGALTLGTLLILGYVSYNLWQYQPQARYLFPEIGVIAYACVEGYRKKGGPIPVAILLTGLLVADLYAIATLPASFANHMDRPVSVAAPVTATALRAPSLSSGPSYP